mmetsp:Transcript_27758/g.70072  ORF Transcript_27758/g.70072 Transcript_27758/m.70072 type:complete len:299 (-) Transcript_27758:71-967(-)|eukprot:CAMPEP_0178994330 /NCGR_PEP_ID=MMETSP0795-20121207/7214_1 /TAXON_ID=88552 /ORGANISM="Amoebophrya sp., Strain Ameob2" /LENGTH=298 /DNA_ID=CAMNT_0020686519 /DNA_START=35 /DNA_END=931 /DNA_ORIENTATION=+
MSSKEQQPTAVPQQATSDEQNEFLSPSATQRDDPGVGEVQHQQPEEAAPLASQPADVEKENENPAENVENQNAATGVTASAESSGEQPTPSIGAVPSDPAAALRGAAAAEPADKVTRTLADKVREQASQPTGVRFSSPSSIEEDLIMKMSQDDGSGPLLSTRIGAIRADMEKLHSELLSALPPQEQSLVSDQLKQRLNVGVAIGRGGVASGSDDVEEVEVEKLPEAGSGSREPQQAAAPVTGGNGGGLLFSISPGPWRSNGNGMRMPRNQDMSSNSCSSREEREKEMRTAVKTLLRLR